MCSIEYSSQESSELKILLRHRQRFSVSGGVWTIPPGTVLAILKMMRKAFFSVSMPQEEILNLDSTLLSAYGQLEGRLFNFHSHDSGYHPFLYYAGHTHDLIQIRTGNICSTNGTVDFPNPALNEYLTEYKDIRLRLRVASSFL